METTYTPLSKRRLGELKGYVAFSTLAFRSLLFAAALAVFAWLAAGAQRVLLPPDLRRAAWWLLPTLAAGVLLYRYAKRWTGGPAFRAAVRADLERGVAAVHRVRAVDAIEVEVVKDEGPSFFVLTADGETILFSGQYLERYAGKGFPWREFEILEAPESKVFFGLKPLGDRLRPSLRRPAFTWDEYKAFRMNDRNYARLEVDFETLRSTARQLRR